MRPVSHTVIHAFLAAAAGLACWAAPLGAQSDEQTLARYRLTEATLAKFAQATHNLVAAAKANPSVLKEQDEEQDDDEKVETLADMAAVYDRHPVLKQAITGAGLTTREFATFVMSMFQAGLAASLVEMRQGKLDSLPAGVPRENVLFYQRHKAELDRIGQELHALEPEKKAPAEDEPPEPRR